MAPPRKYDDRREEIVTLLALGNSVRQVAARLGIPKSHVGRIAKEQT